MALSDMRPCLNQYGVISVPKNVCARISHKKSADSRRVEFNTGSSMRQCAKEKAPAKMGKDEETERALQRRTCAAVGKNEQTDQIEGGSDGRTFLSVPMMIVLSLTLNVCGLFMCFVP